MGQGKTRLLSSMGVKFAEDRRVKRTSSIWKIATGLIEHDIFVEQGRPRAGSRRGCALVTRIITIRPEVF